MTTVIYLAVLLALSAACVNGQGFRHGGDARRLYNATGPSAGRNHFGGVLGSLFGSQPGSSRAPHSPSGSRHHFNGRPHPSGFGFPLGHDVAFTKWNRSVAGAEVTQIGLSQATEEKVVILSFDPRLQAGGLERGAVLYDSSTAVPTTVVKVRNSCFLLPASGVDAAIEVVRRNGTLVSEPLRQVEMNATGHVLTAQQRQELEGDSLNLQMFCANLPIFDTAPLAAGTLATEATSLPEGQRILATLTLDSKVSILAEVSPQARGFFGFGHGGFWHRENSSRTGGHHGHHRDGVRPTQPATTAEAVELRLP